MALLMLLLHVTGVISVAVVVDVVAFLTFKMMLLMLVCSVVQTGVDNDM